MEELVAKPPHKTPGPYLLDGAIEFEQGLRFIFDDARILTIKWMSLGIHEGLEVISGLRDYDLFSTREIVHDLRIGVLEAVSPEVCPFDEIHHISLVGSVQLIDILLAEVDYAKNAVVPTSDAVTVVWNPLSIDYSEFPGIRSR
ncbi:hypothetical protein [Gordonia malaquae]|uniref:hypothetical protein n=1 Tax=Gordonia malaquae TaxID=410332 RepID=UPI000590096E|nr:hypothetical protein [Gordonia malaquae]